MASTMAGAAAFTGAACTPSFALDRPPNFLVYISDSMRADALGIRNRKSDSSPSVDALASRSFVFDACYAQSSWTKPSVASMFTGMMPRVHQAAVTPWRAAEGVETPPRMLRTQFTTWADSMQALGYRTACFQTNPHPREDFGFDQGFDEFTLEIAAPAHDQAAAVRRWLANHGGEPFFVFVHQLDPHGPYKPFAGDFLKTHGERRHIVTEGVPKEDIERIDAWTHSYSPEHADDMAAARSALNEMSPAGLRYFRMLYDAQVHRADRAFGDLLGQLAAQDLAESTVVIFASDHGEAFGEHGVFGHGNTLFIEELHVPLVVHLPNQRRGVQVDAPVALYDLYPTCVALAGGQPDASLMARALLDETGTLMSRPDRAVFAELDSHSPEGERWAATMIEDGKSITAVNYQDDPELFMAHDLGADPVQQAALPGSRLEDSPSWKLRIERFRERVVQNKKLARKMGSPEISGEPDEYEEELRALGYV